MAHFLPLDGHTFEPSETEVRAAFLRGMSDAQYGAVTGALLPDVTTPQSVRTLKNRLDPSVRALDGQVAACAALPPERRAAWNLFSTAWRAFFDGPDNNSPFPSWVPLLGDFGSAPVFDAGLVFEAQIVEWQKLLDSTCTPALPRVVPQNEPHQQDSDNLGSIAKWAALGVVGIAGLLVLSNVRK